MQYDPIQSQGHGHEPLKGGNLSIFEGCLRSPLLCVRGTTHILLDGPKLKAVNVGSETRRYAYRLYFTYCWQFKNAEIWGTNSLNGPQLKS